MSNAGRDPMPAGEAAVRARPWRFAVEAVPRTTEAAEEPDTGALAVVRRPAPQNVDRKEEAPAARLLAEFRRGSGKRAALVTVGAPAPAPARGVGRSEGVAPVEVPAVGRSSWGATPSPGENRMNPVRTAT
ncbi:hypothetical protein [Streptomyces sp. HUAS TT3]|uniref:hypothetical protein n=1 Tax=Streptomyces sp. HUAS TT3 TaxID=3447510 RepID=UPI003F6587A6